MTPVERLEAAIGKANNMVLGASFAIMDSASSPAEQVQARYFQTLFSALRNLLQSALGDAGGSHDEPGAFEHALILADAINAGGTE